MTVRAPDELEWLVDDVAYRAPVGTFELVVWPGVGPAGGAGPYQAWVSIPDAGNTEGLPYHEGFDTVAEAKVWIERDFRRFLERHLAKLPVEE